MDIIMSMNMNTGIITAMRRWNTSIRTKPMSIIMNMSMNMSTNMSTGIIIRTCTAIWRT